MTIKTWDDSKVLGRDHWFLEIKDTDFRTHISHTLKQIWLGLYATSLFCLGTDMSKFYFEIEKLKEILLSIGYSSRFIDKCISKCMNKLYIKKPVSC